MIEDRVGELHLRLRTDMDDPAALRPAAERTVRAVLERCAALLEARAPGRVVLIRRLPLRWRVDEGGLDAAATDALARAVADAIERSAACCSLDPPPADADAVLFADEAHLRASHLLALARDGPGWVHAALEEPGAGEPLAALAAPQRRATALAALGRLASTGVLADVLAARPAAAVAVLAAAFGLDGSTVQPGTAGTLPMDGPAVRALAETASAWPPLPAAGRTLALRIHAAVLLDVGPDAPAAITLARAAALPIQADAGHAPAPDTIMHASIDRTECGGPQPLPPQASLVTTRFAGLFYLLHRVQELDIAESLWQACLPEGAVLAAAAAALLGVEAAGDPAPGLFGGVAEVRCPNVSMEQHAEVAVMTCAALAAALPRRGLADIPPVVVALAYHATGRLLIAAAEGSPFALFAWPAATPAALQAGLRVLLHTWPHRGVMTASPALAALDPAARLRPLSGAAPTQLFLPAAPSAPAAALLALIVGAPCALFAARAGPPFPGTAAAFVAARLQRRARITLSPDRIDVLLDDAEVDLDLRRAGLDRDPGWIPWLQREVRFVFTPAEGE